MVCAMVCQNGGRIDFYIDFINTTAHVFSTTSLYSLVLDCLYNKKRTNTINKI